MSGATVSAEELTAIANDVRNVSDGAASEVTLVRSQRWRQAMRAKDAIWRLLLVGAAASNLGCSMNKDTGHNAARQKEVIERLKAYRGKTELFDVKQIVGPDVARVCVQGPYMVQELFEQEVGRPVTSFTATRKDRYTWWLFDEKDKSMKIEIPITEVMALGGPHRSICFSTSDHALEIDSTGQVSK